jgi:hypothetical protein
MAIQKSQGNDSIDSTNRYITRRRVLVFTITQSCSILSTIFSATGLASRRYSLNCSSEQSAATPCASTSSRALGQNYFTRPKAWLTYVVEASAMKLRNFCGASRSHSSRDDRLLRHLPADPPLQPAVGRPPLGPPALSSAVPSLRPAS